MNRKWLWVGAVAVLGAGAGGAYMAGLLPVGGVFAGAMAKSKPDAKKEITLEFTAREVAQSSWPG